MARTHAPRDGFTATDGGAHVELRGVSKRFGEALAVDDLTLDIEKGSFTTLLGPSGCGKTTTLRMLAGFFDPDEGDILVAGRSQKGIPPHRRNVSIVFQDYALFPHMTVRQNVGYGLKLRRLGRAEREDRVDRVLRMLGLQPYGGRHPHELSGGQQQRVALGRSIVMEPDVLLMDEPLSNLDAKLRVRVRAELKEIQRTLGITTVYVTHDQDEALSMSDRVAVLSDGRLQQVSDPWTLYHAPRNAFVADFVGHANFLPVQVERREGERTVVTVHGRSLVCHDPHGVGTSGAEAVAMIRPEWLEVVPAAGRDPQDDGSGRTFDGTVRTSTFLGSFARVWLDVDGLERPLVLDVSASSSTSLESGRPMTVRVPDGRPVVLAEAPSDVGAFGPDLPRRDAAQAVRATHGTTA